jgi:hypothetical protein
MADELQDSAESLQHQSETLNGVLSRFNTGEEQQPQFSGAERRGAVVSTAAFGSAMVHRVRASDRVN